jgi:hypothetical protein
MCYTEKKKTTLILCDVYFYLKKDKSTHDALSFHPEMGVYKNVIYV